MMQTGDPSGTGRGGKSFFGHPFGDEYYKSKLSHDARGILSMANKGKDTNTSQLYVALLQVLFKQFKDFFCLFCH
jgi:peptidyl-prolyl cis-trans isomerase-like protein 2